MLISSVLTVVSNIFCAFVIGVVVRVFFKCAIVKVVIVVT